MAKLIFLGTANAIPDENHENTHMVVVGKERIVLIDCVNSAMLRLQKAGVDFKNLTDLILTHFHPDHVSGVPQLLMNMWLMGHKRPLNIYGLQYTLDRIEDLMGFYGWSEWPNFFPVTFFRLPAEEMAKVLDCEEFRIYASPVQHFIPNIGLRIEFVESQKVVAYSCDTEPCEQVIRLAEGADLLIHEASGALPGHSSAEQAGKAARESEAGSLCLIHYPTGQFAEKDLLAEARKQFQGPVTQAEDYMELEFG
jgi:ribonuclease Z